MVILVLSVIEGSIYDHKLLNINLDPSIDLGLLWLDNCKIMLQNEHFACSTLMHDVTWIKDALFHQLECDIARSKKVTLPKAWVSKISGVS